MKKNLRFIIIFSCLILLQFSCHFVEEYQLNKLQLKIYNSINNRQFEEVALLFTYSKNYDNAEIKRITKCFDVLSKFTGRIGFEKDVPLECKYHISIFTGDTAYWKNTPVFTDRIYPVNFEEIDNGWLEVEYYKKSMSSLGIKKITYQLKTNNEAIFDELRKLGCLIEIIPTHDERFSSEYGDYFGIIKNLFYQTDPLGINQRNDSTFYKITIYSVLYNLKNCESKYQVRILLKKEFIDFFDPEYTIPGIDTLELNKSLIKLSDTIWYSWKQYKINLTAN
jgi:hypothetical protein